MVVKCDIEGGELAVVTDMVVTGAMEVVDNLHIVTIITIIIIIMEVVDNLHMEWHGVQGPGFLRTGEEAEMIDKLAQAVS